jgi:glycine/D-amino acid oxidase-like deaminating enzyme
MILPMHQSIGTSVCGGLSLLHYNSFKQAPSLSALRKKIASEMPEYIQHGIHVMVSQHEAGELTVGDSHEYGFTFEPFDQQYINQLILQYLNRFMYAESWQLTQTWNGVYPKMTDGSSWFVSEPINDVYILNGLGGAGMTLSFAVAEKMIEEVI